MGDGDSEVIRNLMVTHLTEKGYLLKPKIPADQITGEIDMHDHMITALVELLEEKGHVNYAEWERLVKKKVTKK